MVIIQPITPILNNNSNNNKYKKPKDKAKNELFEKLLNKEKEKLNGK